MVRGRTNRRALRALLAGLAAVVLAVHAAPAAMAEDAEATASIAGTVVRAADGAPVAGAQVEAWAEDGIGHGSAETQADGSYLIEGLVAGDYEISFAAAGQGLVRQYWNGAHVGWELERVPVADGEAVVGIDAALVAGGSISGTVTREPDGAPLAAASVSVNGDAGSFAAGSTDENGAYRIDGLLPDDYVVSFSAADGGLVREYWDGVHELSQAGRVTVVAGEDSAGIDASLQTGGSISGTVTRSADGSPVAGASVQVSEVAGSDVGSVSTDAEGAYRIDGLLPGDYTVFFRDADDTLVAEYWDSTTDLTAALPVDVAAGEVATGIDASLDAASTITGRVTRASDGSAVEGEVGVIDESGIGYQGTIGADGRYSVNVPPGTYAIVFRGRDAELIDEYWDDARTRAEATPVTVSSGETRDGIDAVLEAGLAITGTVRSEGAPLADVFVEARGDAAAVATSTDADGAYKLYVPSGTYTVSAQAYPIDEVVYATQFYDGAATAAEATPVTVGPDTGLDGVDFDLEPGSDIRGTVTAEGGIDPDGEGVTVIAYRWSSGEWHEVTRSPSWGAYSFNGWGVGIGPLPAGTYTIGVEAAGRCTQYYGDATALADAESFVLAAGSVVEDIDVALTADCGAPAPTLRLSASTVQQGATITVTGAHFSPGEKVTLELHSTPTPLGSVVADADGSISGTITIPRDAAVGAHHVVAFGEESSAEASAALEVRAAGGADAPGELSETGAAAPTAIAVLGLALIVVGGLFVRRRRAASGA